MVSSEGDQPPPPYSNSNTKRVYTDNLHVHKIKVDHRKFLIHMVLNSGGWPDFNEFKYFLSEKQKKHFVCVSPLCWSFIFCIKIVQRY